MGILQCLWKLIRKKCKDDLIDIHLVKKPKVTRPPVPEQTLACISLTMEIILITNAL